MENYDNFKLVEALNYAWSEYAKSPEYNGDIIFPFCMTAVYNNIDYAVIEDVYSLDVNDDGSQQISEIGTVLRLMGPNRTIYVSARSNITNMDEVLAGGNTYHLSTMQRFSCDRTKTNLKNIDNLAFRILEDAYEQYRR